MDITNLLPQTPWIDLIIGGLIGAILSALASLSIRFYESKRLKKSLTFKSRSTWKSSWLLILDSKSLITHTEWIKETISFKSGLLSVKFYVSNTSPNSQSFSWKGKITKNLSDSILGTWESTKEGSTARGTFNLIRSTKGNYLYGFYTGRSDDGQFIHGPWGLGIDDASLKKALEGLMDPYSLIKSNNVSQADYKKVFHIYHATQRNGKKAWMYHPIDFSQSVNNYQLRGQIDSINLKNESVPYKVTAAKWDNRFILLQQNEKFEENLSIQIYPNINKNIENDHPNYGLTIGYDWGNIPYIGKAIISGSPLITSDEQTLESKIVDKKYYLELDRKWRKGFNQVSNLRLNKSDEKFLIDGGPRLYSDIKSHFGNRDFNERLEIIVLGYTMRSGSNALESWIETGRLHKADLKFYYINPKFIQSTDRIQNSWINSVHEGVNQMKNLLIKRKELLEKYDISVTLIAYNYFPVIHGIKFNKSHYWLSISALDINGNLRSRENDFFIPLTTESEDYYDRSMIILFENWLSRGYSIDDTT